MLTLRQMLQRLAILLVQVKAGNTLEKLLNETWKILYSLHRAKIFKTVYNNITNLILYKK